MAKSKKPEKKVVAKKSKPTPIKAAGKASVKPTKIVAKAPVAKKQQVVKSKSAAKSAAKPGAKPDVKAKGMTKPVKVAPQKTSVKGASLKASTKDKSKELKKQAKNTAPVKALKPLKEAKKDNKSEEKKTAGKKEISNKTTQISEKDIKAALKTKGKEKPAKAAKKAKEEEEDDFVDPFDLIDGDDELAGIEIEAYLDTETTEEFTLNVSGEEIIEEEVFLTDAEGNRLCKIKDCDDIATTDGHCRYHYLLFWKKIQLRRKILAGGKLDRYIEELTSRYPDKYLEVLRKDLATEKNFLAALSELEIEDAGDTDLPDESEDLIEEVRGTVSHTGAGSDDDSF